SKAYIANKADRMFITVIDLKSRKVTGHIPMPNGTEGIVASPDGKRVVAVDYKDPEMVVIDTKTDMIIDKASLKDNTKAAFRVAYSPDGKYILVDNSAQQLVNVFEAADIHGPQHVISVGKGAMGFAFAPDGHTALVGNHGEGTVSVIDLQTDSVLKTFQAGKGIETLAYY